MDPERDGQGVQTNPEKLQSYMIPLQYWSWSKTTKPAFKVGAPLAYKWNAI